MPGDATTFGQLADNASKTGDELVQGVLRVIYDGYPNDASKIRLNYNLTEGQFRYLTQQAIWYYTDSTGLALQGSDGITLSQNEQNAYNALIYSKTTLPESLTLEIFKANDGTYQNLLATRFVHPQEVVLENELLTHEIKIQKVGVNIDKDRFPIDWSFTTLIPSAEIQIFSGDSINGKLVRTYISGTSAETLRLAPGTYTFHETEAPDGYKITPDFQFTVGDNGKVSLLKNYSLVKFDSVTNMLKVYDRRDDGKIDIGVTKNWTAAQGYTVPNELPEVWFKIEASVNGSSIPLAEGFTNILKIENNACEWQGLLSKNPSDNPINYTVTEVLEDGSPWKAAGWVAGKVTGDADHGFSVTNTYQPQAAQAQIQVHKKLVGKELEAGAFTFELKDNLGTFLDTQTNAADGSVTFKPISYTETGTYSYTVTEKAGDDPNITYDQGTISVKVEVTFNDSGELQANVSYSPAEGTFTNEYTEPTESTPNESEGQTDGSSPDDTDSNGSNHSESGLVGPTLPSGLKVSTQTTIPAQVTVAQHNLAENNIKAEELPKTGEQTLLAPFIVLLCAGLALVVRKHS